MLYADSVIFDFPADGDVDGLKTKFRLGSPAYGHYKMETKSPIATYASLGPKNYSYVTTGEKENGDVVEVEKVVKVRGLTLNNASALEVVNHGAMKELITGFLADNYRELESENFSMKVDRANLTVQNTVVKKKYHNRGFDKRWVCNNPDSYITSYPFGIKHTEFADIPK